MGELIKGTNLGNWLVLEKWMKPDLFESTHTEDETWLSRKLPADEFAKLIKEHRDTYVTEEDFRFLAEHGVNAARLPVPYFAFGDRPPFVGCIEWIDKAMDWGEKHGIRLLLDLHTVPYSQNGYDNGGITGVCKWKDYPDEVEFALTVLERLAERYGKRDGLLGIEVLNEPISWIVYRTAPSTGKAVDKEEAKGSGYVPLPFLRDFYTKAYARIRKHMGTEKTVVFHDGFRCTSWNKFFWEAKFINVALDTHPYIFAMENFVPVAKPWVYKLYLWGVMNQIRKAQKDIPVIVGEWCICNKYADKVYDNKELCAARYREIANIELDAWKETAGWFYWNYQLLRDREAPTDQTWKQSWDFARCINNGWLDPKDF